MLVFARSKRQRVIITTPDGEKIIVSIDRIDGEKQRVRLGFEAPPEFSIDREEIHDKKLLNEQLPRK